MKKLEMNRMSNMIIGKSGCAIVNAGLISFGGALIATGFGTPLGIVSLGMGLLGTAAGCS